MCRFIPHTSSDDFNFWLIQGNFPCSSRHEVLSPPTRLHHNNNACWTRVSWEKGNFLWRLFVCARLQMCLCTLSSNRHYKGVFPFSSLTLMKNSENIFLAEETSKAKILLPLILRSMSRFWGRKWIIPTSRRRLNWASYVVDKRTFNELLKGNPSKVFRFWAWQRNSADKRT